MPQPFAHNPIGGSFIELQSVDSTNNYARRLVHEGVAEHGMVIFAHEQIAGKGQRSKTWLSEKGANIIMTVICKPNPLKVSDQFQLSMMTAVTAQNFLAEYTEESVYIKWPNDLYYKDRKAGGILIESVIGQQSAVSAWQWAIIGIGININQTTFPSELPNPVSLKQITGKDFDTVLLAKELCNCLEKYFQQLITGNFESIFSQYNSCLYKKDKKVKLKKGNRVFEVTIKNVSPSGKLIVQHGIEEELDFGDVEWVIEKVK